jgi:uncharacterized damage-inducible protein DinB
MSEQEQPAFPRNKDGLVAQIQAARLALWSFVDSLSDADMTTLRDAQGWAVKDHLVHLALWQNGIAALLRHQPRWPAMGLTAEEARNSADADAINTLLQPRHADMTAQSVRQFLRDSQDALDVALAPLSTEDLHKSYSSFQPDEPDKDTIVAAYVIGDSCGHYEEHLPWMEAITQSK